jgi:hypothetical protein
MLPSWGHGPYGGIAMTLFNGSSPRLSTALAMAKEEAWLWGMAEAKDLALLAGQEAPEEV